MINYLKSINFIPILASVVSYSLVFVVLWFLVVLLTNANCRQHERLNCKIVELSNCQRYLFNLKKTTWIPWMRNDPSPMPTPTRTSICVVLLRASVGLCVLALTAMSDVHLFSPLNVWASAASLGFRGVMDCGNLLMYQLNCTQPTASTIRQRNIINGIVAVHYQWNELNSAWKISRMLNTVNITYILKSVIW